MIINGDCLEELKKLESESVDLVLTDPPYGTTPCKWDSIIPFDRMWGQLNRVCKKNSVVCLFGTEPFSSALRMSNIKDFKYDWVWEKNRSLGANFCHAKNSPIKITENIHVFSKSKIQHLGKSKNRMPYYPQGLVPFGKKIKGTISPKINSFKHDIYRDSFHEYIQEFTNYPDNVLRFDFCKETKERKNRFHPTQKPEKLLSYLIKTYTSENQIVLDFTMGSGSTGVAAVGLNRKFIGIEKEPEYFEIAKTRIENSLKRESVVNE